jgi:hypothetical protein
MSRRIRQARKGLITAVSALLLSVAGGSPTQAAVELAGAPSDGWAHWQVEQQPGTGEACCFAADGQRGCRLRSDGRGHGLSLKPAQADPKAQGLQVWVRYRQGEVQAIHAIANACPIEAEGEVTRIENMSSERSSAWLLAQASAAKPVEGVVPALGLHAGEAATAALLSLTEPERPSRLRRDAAFWLGHARAEAGLERVLAMLQGPESSGFLRHLIFVLSQSPLPAADQALRELARTHPDTRLRGEALFWMAQSGKAGAREALFEVLVEGAELGLQQQAVFALSQLEGGDSALISVIGGDFPRPAKRQALFWLGQSGSAEALAFLDRYLAGQP